ncbi:S ribonuclease [Pyrus ussuriensis x Pyrus communis]|uniref:S ribonuclease n=1 Tax=Pyrus ussuriensis x Pyrus communis TaxID=2448454 RepID=A0A5N5HRG3_9ROSA|nr:S ribonuclease [Pyrus ussuriensis x Pyrus communis]
MLDALVGGALVDKTPVDAKILIANRAHNAQQYEGVGQREGPRQQSVNEGQENQTTAMQNQDKKVDHLEKQIGQIAEFVGQFRDQGNLPSSTIVNPKGGFESAKAITLRSGKEVGTTSTPSKTGPNEDKKLQLDEEEPSKPTARVETPLPQASKDPNASNSSNSATKGKLGSNSINSNPVPPNVPFPHRFLQTKKEEHEKDILETFRKVQVNIPLLDAIKQVPKYAKFLKELCTTRKRASNKEVVRVSENVFAVLQRKLPPKCKDPEQPPTLELKPLPNHLKYVFLGEQDTLPVIVASSLTAQEEEKLVRVLKEHKMAIGWTLADIKGISPTTCMHRILMEEGAKPSREAQRRLNPPMMEVVKKEIIKLLDCGVIYPISDSCWVSPVQVVPKKSGVTVVKNEENELVPTRIQTGFYRRFIKDFSKIAQPLCRLLQKEVAFEFNEECENAFKHLKDMFTTAPIILPPDWTLPFELMCDASDYAIGAVLGQRKNKQPHVIYYASRTLNDAQLNYSATEKELLAVVFALDKFRSYLLGTKVIAYSDHAALSEPWYADLVNFLVSKRVPSTIAKHQRDKLKKEARFYVWDDPYLWKFCAD